MNEFTVLLCPSYGCVVFFTVSKLGNRIFPFFIPVILALFIVFLMVGNHNMTLHIADAGTVHPVLIGKKFMAFGQVVYVGKFFLVCSELDLVGKHVAHIVFGVVELQQFRELAGVQYLLPFLAFIFLQQLRRLVQMRNFLHQMALPDCFDIPVRFILIK